MSFYSKKSPSHVFSHFLDFLLLLQGLFLTKYVFRVLKSGIIMRNVYPLEWEHVRSRGMEHRMLL